MPPPSRTGTIVASLNASAPRFRLLDRVDEAARELRSVADSIAIELGGPVADGG